MVKPFISNSKYETTGGAKEVGGRILHQIRAVDDFGDISKGMVGGWIEHESNLSKDGDCGFIGMHA